MKVDILLGLQWGDEGKGKIVDALSPAYDAIARFQGGPNAGHSLEFHNVKHVLHLIPSGIFHPEKLNIIGNGVVLDPAVFREEVLNLGMTIEEVSRRLVISRKAHLILPGHRLLDAFYEWLKGKEKIGSTLKGIGPAYTDKSARNGMRVGDIERPDFKELYRSHFERHLKIVQNYKHDFNLDTYEAGWFDGIEMLKQFRLVNSEYLVHGLVEKGNRILAEGAQGTMLDIDFGSYPFVTSSNTISAGACTGLGISPGQIGDVFGIFKAYCTRVGSGPFPTELCDDTGDKLRKTGAEFGATTGRPRRCGWLDIPALKYAVMINGVTKLFMTKADVLKGFNRIKVCTAYRINNIVTTEVPYETDSKIEPVYEELPGWSEDISGMRDYDSLPDTLKSYIRFIEQKTGVPVTMISVGPDRKETIFRQ
ncbi:MAG: adenylosuccinate synthase [Bacteroidales bacterium]